MSEGNMRRSTWKLLFRCLLAAAILAGCQTKKSILLEDTLCEPPCWQKITPGKSSSDEAYQILSGLPFLHTAPLATPKRIDDFRSYDSWNFQKNMRERGGVITYFNDTVAYMEFDVRGTLKIGEMIDFYGKPELLSVISGWNDSRWLEVRWIYPDKGVLITHFDHNWRPEGNYASITPDLPVYDVYYFDPELYDTLVETVFFSPTRREVVQESIRPWVDYGPVPYTEE
jgi:hypothetical protein